jgi:hypothetical protein
LITVILFVIVIGVIISYLETFTFATVWGDIDTYTATMFSRLISSPSCFAAEETYISRDVSSPYISYSNKRVRAGLIDFKKLAPERVLTCIDYNVTETSGADRAKLGAEIGYSIRVVDLITNDEIFSEIENTCYGERCSQYSIRAPVMIKYFDGDVSPARIYFTFYYHLTKRGF